MVRRSCSCSKLRSHSACASESDSDSEYRSLVDVEGRESTSSFSSEADRSRKSSRDMVAIGMLEAGAGGEGGSTWTRGLARTRLTAGLSGAAPDG